MKTDAGMHFHSYHKFLCDETLLLTLGKVYGGQKIIGQQRTRTMTVMLLEREGIIARISVCLLGEGVF